MSAEAGATVHSFRVGIRSEALPGAHDCLRCAACAKPIYEAGRDGVPLASGDWVHHGCRI